jgi:hypothetical protein
MSQVCACTRHNKIGQAQTGMRVQGSRSGRGKEGGGAVGGKGMMCPPAQRENAFKKSEMKMRGEKLNERTLSTCAKKNET